MEAMELEEEERRRKEELDQRELEDAIGGIRDFLQGRDFSGKGSDVLPTSLQDKRVEEVARLLRVSAPSMRKRVIGEHISLEDAAAIDSATLNEFDLLAKKRVLINRGPIVRKEKETLLRKTSKKYLFLFSDVVLITSIKDGSEQYDLQCVLWVKDLRLRYLEIDSDKQIEWAFELISLKSRTRPQQNFIFVCENELNYRTWMEDLENCLLAYHCTGPLSKQLGWHHDLIQGTFHSAACTGDLNTLRKFLRRLELSKETVDVIDASGMTPLHWSVLRSQEVCVRLLLDCGADPDFRQKGGNTCLLLAATQGLDGISRLLIERGGDVMARNHMDRDAVFMSVVYGHASKGLPWMLALLTSRGMDLSLTDRSGYTPLHICAERNLARPVKMLVDAGADVNAKHGLTQLTPLQMACNSFCPDVETIRSFLDKGAYPNWKDLQGRTAFDLVLMKASTQTPSSPSSPSCTENMSSSTSDSRSPGGNNNSSPEKWRPMEGTLEKVGNFAVKVLPVVLEIVKKGLTKN